MIRSILVAVLVLPTITTSRQPSSPGASMLVSVTELAASLDSPSLVLLHVAERPSAYEASHIPGARFVRYGDFAVDGDGLGSELPPADTIKRVFEAAGVSDDSRVVVYAQSPVLAARAFFTLDVFGHSRVAVLDGGLQAWHAAKQPVESGPATPSRAGRFTPRLNSRRLADAAFIQRQAPGKSIALIDVRPDPEYYGSDGGMGGAHAAGHIAGARQLTWNSLIGADGRYLPPVQLSQRFASADAAPGRPVVSYCMVGMRASVVYFVARRLGFDAKLYDGSIVDWSRRKLPVTRQ